MERSAILMEREWTVGKKSLSFLIKNSVYTDKLLFHTSPSIGVAIYKI